MVLWMKMFHHTQNISVSSFFPHFQLIFLSRCKLLILLFISSESFSNNNNKKLLNIKPWIYSLEILKRKLTELCNFNTFWQKISFPIDLNKVKSNKCFQLKLGKFLNSLNWESITLPSFLQKIFTLKFLEGIGRTSLESNLAVFFKNLNS